ncbi:hypothetical protein FM106_06185 [Brachybacterium faecium]|nr:hypothetical protein FM106_06185 [Brachybacterium faecium]
MGWVVRVRSNLQKTSRILLDSGYLYGCCVIIKKNLTKR